MKNNTQVFIILGAPGAGKGTQANLLAELFGLEHNETSQVIESFFNSDARTKDTELEIEGKIYPISEDVRKWKEGELCSPPFVVWLLEKKIENLAEQGKGIVFSGSPRTIYETERIMPFLKELYGSQKIKIFFLKLSVEDSVWRNTHRRICKLMRHPILWHEETENLTICPLDGSELLRRELDRPEIIKERYRVFEKRTLPILKWMEQHQYGVTEINGAPPVAEVFQSILSNC